MKTTLPLLLLILVHSVFGVSGSADITHWNGSEYETYIDYSLIEASPEWNAEPNTLPFSSTQALSLTNDWMKKSFPEDEWFLASISLQKYPLGGRNHWAWFLDYRNGESSVGHVTEEGREIKRPDRLSFVVTLNGDLAAPKKN